MNTLVVIVFVAVCVTSAFAQAMEAHHESSKIWRAVTATWVTGGNPFHDAIPNLLMQDSATNQDFSVQASKHMVVGRKSTWMMPAFPLSEGERHALKAYLATLQNAQIVRCERLSEAVKIGDKIATKWMDVTTQSRCQRCHVIDGEGGQTGND